MLGQTLMVITQCSLLLSAKPIGLPRLDRLALHNTRRHSAYLCCIEHLLPEALAKFLPFHVRRVRPWKFKQKLLCGQRWCLQLLIIWFSCPINIHWVTGQQSEEQAPQWESWQAMSKARCSTGAFRRESLAPGQEKLLWLDSTKRERTSKQKSKRQNKNNRTTTMSHFPIGSTLKWKQISGNIVSLLRGPESAHFPKKVFKDCLLSSKQPQSRSGEAVQWCDLPPEACAHWLGPMLHRD